MNLEVLFENIKETEIILINEKGEVVDSFPEQNKYKDIENKISVFSRIALDMSIDFFNTFFDSKVQELIIKSDEKHIFLYRKQENEILCFLSDKAINTAIITLTIKKNKGK